MQVLGVVRFGPGPQDDLVDAAQGAGKVYAAITLYIDLFKIKILQDTLHVRPGPPIMKWKPKVDVHPKSAGRLRMQLLRTHPN